MIPEISIHIFDELEGVVSDDWLRSVAERALSSESRIQEGRGSALGVVIADDATVRELNRRHRDIDETTDVLSFAFDHQAEYHEGESTSGLPDSTDFVLPHGQSPMLGEVIISYPQALLQAEASGIDVQQELAHLLTHGVLHLLGYDHATPEEYSVMKALEHKVLSVSPHNE